MQECARSEPLTGAVALRWSPCGSYLAVPCTSEVAIFGLHGGQLSRIASLPGVASELSTLHGLDCAWLRGALRLAVWRPVAGSGSFVRFQLFSGRTWAGQPVASLPAVVSKPQWGWRWLAATAADGRLGIWAEQGPGQPWMLTCWLLAPLPVGRSARLTPPRPIWAGLTAYAWSPFGRYLACLPAPRVLGAEVVLELRDTQQGGSAVWTHALRGTAGADRPGQHHMTWAADGLALVVVICAGYPRKFKVSFACETVGPCGPDCQGGRLGTCPGYDHLEPEFGWA